MAVLDLSRPVSGADVATRNTVVERTHRIALWIVTILAFLTRFCGLDHPSETVYDEAHIVRFVSWYLKRSFFFDVHPPFGKLLYLAVAWLAGYDGNLVTYDIGVSFVDHHVPYLAMRSFSALLSSLTVSMVYLIMWESGYSVPAGLVAAGLVLFDNAQITQTRLIYLDSILCFSILCSLYSYIRFSRAREQPFSRSWWTWLLLTGLGLSCSISTKYVGLFTYLTIGTFIIVDLLEMMGLGSEKAASPSDFLKHFAARFVCLLLFPFMLYLAWFKIHFTILSQPGQGIPYMGRDFVRGLLRNGKAGRTLYTPPFFKSWLEFQNVMLFDGSLTSDAHPYESKPSQWPLLSGGISFWCSDENRQQIFFLGNVPGWALATMSLLILLTIMIVDQISPIRGRSLSNRGTRSRFYRSAVLFLLAWAFHYFPFFLMDRRLMLHNYLPAHVLSTMVAGSLLDFLEPTPKDKLFTAQGTTTEKQQMHTDSNSKKEMHMDSSPKRNAPKAGTEQSPPKAGTSNMLAWGVCGMILSVVFAWWYFWIPVTYGTPGLSIEALRRRDPFDIWLLYAWE